jgi:hypothetical protein
MVGLREDFNAADAARQTERAMTSGLDRRDFLGVAAGTAAAVASTDALAQTPRRGGNAPAETYNFSATPPAGFTPLSIPGRVVRVNKPGSLRTGGLFPRPEAAREMVDRVVMELSGRNTVAEAWRQFVHPQDRVAVKVNGLGLRNMASNKEVVEAIVAGVIAAGVPATAVTVYDQWDSFLQATRVSARALPAGVRVMSHNGTRLAPETRVASGRTQYALPLLEATAVIGVPLIKDHSLSGFTGALKNMTHGSIKTPRPSIGTSAPRRLPSCTPTRPSGRASGSTSWTASRPSTTAAPATAPSTAWPSSASWPAPTPSPSTASAPTSSTSCAPSTT